MFDMFTEKKKNIFLLLMIADAPKNIQEILKRLPQKPGVYQYFDEKGDIIYVGKAKKLKNRVTSYFTKDKYENGKTRLLVSKIRNLEFIVVETEFDALLLENSLIKKHQPRYNIQLRDDKTYPWICIKKERFPRLFPTRTLVKDGSEYYGPYASVKTMKTVLNLVRHLYKFRTCKYNLSDENIKAQKFRVCLEYHIGNCKAPCVANQSEQNYNEAIDNARRIIKGDIGEVIKHMKQLMQEYAHEMRFELAEDAKTQIEALEKYQAKSTVVNPSINNVDVFSVISDDKFGYVNYMKVKNGAIIQSHTLEMKKRLEETNQNLLETAIGEMRSTYNSQSEEIFTSEDIELEIPNVSIHFPQRGDKKKLIDLSLKNVRYFMLDRQKEQEKVDPDRRKNRILGQLQEDLNMDVLPEHIECFDNSNIQGTNPVAACVVFKDAKPSKNDYRKFNIKTVEGPNDFASMEEVVYRRYKRLLEEEEPLPQLIIIDGGKGQLSSAVKSLKKLDLFGKVTIVGIAKRLEEIFFPNDSIPLYIDKKSESLKLIQYLRNEAHRFGITFHRQKRSKDAIQTSLTQIEGIGEKTATKLLRHFRSVKRIEESSLEELKEVVNANHANLVFEFYSNSN
jgi:excinuclease ABC subunit C